MRLTNSLTIPTELERARAAGELVVFAGAGVSMGPPARLPSFIDLAKAIAEPKVAYRRQDEKWLDRYLGRAEREGIDVQLRARDRLGVGGSHTPLHEYLLGIFGSAERVRLITTNFDGHFASALPVVFPGAAIPQYVGPALPPGHDFRGIAQLHGALHREETALVLTNRNFAEAYMAEGWASRFLSRAFADRTVLFVGYSLTDPIMRYLLHALPAGRWYALWQAKEAGQGAEHAITPVTFGKKRSRDPYKDLNDGMKRWYWYARASPTDHDREIRGLVAAGPPASPVETDYLRARLETAEGRAVFRMAADQKTWFEWVASEGLLDGLVDPAADMLEVGEWARWCLEHFCSGEIPPLLRHLRGQPLTLNPAFRSQLVLHLVRRDALPPLPVLRQLIALLVGQSNDTAFHDTLWQLLMKRLVEGDHSREALVLLRSATRLSLQPLERGYPTPEVDEGGQPVLPPLATRVTSQVTPGDIVDFLTKHGSALATAAPDALLALGEQRIEEAYELLELGRGRSDESDWLSFGRSSIAPSAQDRFSHVEDVLVETLRAVLDHLAVSAPAKLEAFTTRHETSARALSRRLALYALSKCTSCSSDEVLSRAAARGWARDFWLRPELYLVLGAHFPRASEAARSQFVGTLRDDAWWGEEFDKHDAHARYSLSVKLLRDAPDSATAREFAAAEREAHPEWREADQEGLLSRFEVRWGGDEPSPIEAEQLLALDAATVLDEVRAALPVAAREHRDVALLGAVQQAARSDAQWGGELLALAMHGDPTATRIAESLLLGLRDGDPDPTVQALLLAQVTEGQWAQELTRTLASVLDHWSRRLGSTAATELLDAFDAAADLIYERSRSVAPGIEGHGWTESAIIHPAGDAAQIWWMVASARDWVDGRHVVTLDDAEKARWARVLRDETAAGMFARPILGMAVDRLIQGDFPWTTAVVLPAFDPSNGEATAAQLWDGRLMQHRWYWGTVEGLRPYLDGMLERSATLLPARSEQLGDRMALLVAGVDESGLALVQLHRFVQHATEEARRAFAYALPGKLEVREPDERRHVWTALLKRYWADRRTNMPLPLSADELGAMVGWAEALPEVAEEVVAALRASPEHRLEHADGILWEWTKEDATWVRDHPAVATGMVAFLAERKSVNSWMSDAAFDILEAAFDAGASKRDVLAAAELLAGVSPTRAAALVKRLRTAS